MSNELGPAIGFVGMSHLGLISATATAEKGFSVIAYDADLDLIDAIDNGELPIEEPELDDMLARNRCRLRFTNQLENLCACDVIYISADVPTSEANVSDLNPIRELIKKIESILTETMTVVLLSQVSPGFTRELTISQNQLYYQVETLIFGQAVHRALYPERFIVGCSDHKRPLPKAYETLLKSFECPILPMRYESAELAKISINLFLVASVTTANTLANVAAAVGADWNEIVPTLKLDKRIGPHAYLNPGLGISGGNLERDLQTVIQLGDKFGANTQLIKTYCDHSQYQKNWVYRCLQEDVFPHCSNPTIAILGLAYKANTHSVKNSPSITLIDLLKKTHSSLQVHDPVVKKQTVSDVLYCDSALEALKLAEVVVMMTPWPEYSRLTTNDYLSQMRGRIIIDPYQVLNTSEFIRAGFSVYTLGVNLSAKQELNEASYA